MAGTCPNYRKSALAHVDGANLVQLLAEKNSQLFQSLWNKISIIEGAVYAAGGELMGSVKEMAREF
ncbi:hypothetical protein [Vibrio europaeus]|uniref:Uncharacterized protein n=1 Tax=Vibrio europaeus TaxID=300876 RepID=A0A178J6F8_9VIBR|nr:hypothetical protein [Vibrio europaeus]MDC5720264.1 hypothetical protein [Vibrio europaeus]OAM97501.1 hypothetical protein AZ468_18315 [Vibrio europaeus]